MKVSEPEAWLGLQERDDMYGRGSQARWGATHNGGEARIARVLEAARTVLIARRYTGLTTIQMAREAEVSERLSTRLAGDAVLFGLPPEQG